MSNSKKELALNHHLPLIIRKYFFFSDSCTRVHGFEEETKFHVTGYMDLKKKQNSMWVHGFEEKTKFHVRGYMNLRKKNQIENEGEVVVWCQLFFGI